MNFVELSPEEKIACSNDRFCSFMDKHEAFTEEEINHLQVAIINKKLSRILYVSATLAVWSMAAAWMDMVILPVLIVYALALPGAIYYPILFPIAWTILNATFKFIFIHKRLGNAVSLRDNLLAVFPYAGGAFLLKNWFVGDPLLKSASLSYIKHQKQRFMNKVFNVFRRD